ncbi:MAG TPA: DUF3795 domain-containing protein [Candidatus Lokiarchaeia archaeon]|nr:DUF3795 domain-containing protein [Candidatus Lokiarchaeia archaeon]
MELESGALIAPCGINCGVCAAYLAYSKGMTKQSGVSLCAGCRVRNKNCTFIKKNCSARIGKEIEYCFQDSGFPCDKLQDLDDRYRRDYGISPIENLKVMRDLGMDAFIEQQDQAFTCTNCGGTISVHNGFCYDCQKDKIETYVKQKKTSLRKLSKRK